MPSAPFPLGCLESRDSQSPGWCLPFPEVCPNPRCNHNALNPAVNLTYEILEDIIREVSAALPDAFLYAVSASLIVRP